jgi:hypothetical protein
VSVLIPAFRRRRARQISTAARAVAQRTPETLILVRHRAQPTAVTVARLAGTAVFAYLVALPIPVTPRPVLAPLTALLVAQVSLYQTLRSSVQRVAAGRGQQPAGGSRGPRPAGRRAAPLADAPAAAGVIPADSRPPDAD